MALKRLSLTRGDTGIYTISFKNGSSGSAVCIKNWAVFFTMKTDPSLPDSDASLQKIVTSFADTTSGTSGVALIALDPADTVDLEPREYDFDIAVCTNSSANYTVMKGKFDLLYDVTRSVGTAGTAI
jgi:hypothetical protein